MFEKEAEEWRNNLNFEIDNDTFHNIVIPFIEFGYNKDFVEADKNLKAVVADFNKAKEWQYVKEGCKYPENGESVLVTVLDDDNEKIVTMALFEVKNNKRFWDIESRLCSVHSGSEEVCSKIIPWARVLQAGGEK